MFVFVQRNEKENELRLKLRVQPGASKSEVAGLHGDSLKLRIAARAVDGAANRAVCAYLAEIFGIAKTSVSILHGESSRTKTVLIQGDGDKILLILEKLI